jgi:hypothetical protein
MVVGPLPADAPIRNFAELLFGLWNIWPITGTQVCI